MKIRIRMRRKVKIRVKRGIRIRLEKIMRRGMELKFKIEKKENVGLEEDGEVKGAGEEKDEV